MPTNNLGMICRPQAHGLINRNLSTKGPTIILPHDPDSVLMWPLHTVMTAYLADGTPLPEPVVYRTGAKHLQTSLSAGQLLLDNTSIPSSVFNNQSAVGLSIEGSVTNDLDNADNFLSWGITDVDISDKIYTDPFGVDNEAQLCTPQTSLNPTITALKLGNLANTNVAFSIWNRLGPVIGPPANDYLNFSIVRLDHNLSILDEAPISPIKLTDAWKLSLLESQFGAILPDETYYGVVIQMVSAAHGAYLRLPYFTLSGNYAQTPELTTRGEDVVELNLAQSISGAKGSLLYRHTPLHSPSDNTDHIYLQISPINATLTSYIRLYHEGATNKLCLTIDDGINPAVTIKSTNSIAITRLSNNKIGFTWKVGSCSLFLNGTKIGSGDVTSVGDEPVPVSSVLTLGNSVSPGWFIPSDFSFYDGALTDTQLAYLTS